MYFWIQSLKNRHGYVPSPLKSKTELSYHPSKDSITLPERYQFIDGKEFDSLLFTKWHIQPDIRKDWQEIFGPFGSAEYAREELIAELSAAVAGRDLGMAVTPRKENAQYLDGWCSRISSDPRFIMTVLNDVNKAVTAMEEGIGLNRNTRIQPKNKIRYQS